jgi:zinc transporter 1
MAWSKSTRIKVMLVIDIMFFFLELSVGFAVHSLALMADAFHMVSPVCSCSHILSLCSGIGANALLCSQLNDVISLLVGLWAVSVASKATTDKFSYGVSYATHAFWNTRRVRHENCN